MKPTAKVYEKALLFAEAPALIKRAIQKGLMSHRDADLNAKELRLLDLSRERDGFRKGWKKDGTAWGSKL